MSKRRDQDYLNDICEAIQRVVSYTEEMTDEQFMNDTRTQDAVVRNLEVIGEATKNLSTRINKDVCPHSLEVSGGHKGQNDPSLLWHSVRDCMDDNQRRTARSSSPN